MNKDQLNMLLRRRGFTSKQLATLLGVSVHAVRKWRQGQRKISSAISLQIERQFRLLDLIEDNFLMKKKLRDDGRIEIIQGEFVDRIRIANSVSRYNYPGSSARAFLECGYREILPARMLANGDMVRTFECQSERKFEDENKNAKELTNV